MIRISLVIALACVLFNDGTSAQRDHGEACKLRSQLINIVRGESGDGCMTSKGLVCFNHKCTCADPSNVYEVPTPDEPSGSSSSSTSQIASSFIGLFKGGDKNKQETTTTTVAPAAGSPSLPAAGRTGGKCVGRAGSPCFTATSTCVKHAKCEGAPRLCKCQGIYGSNTSGYCSKSANVVNQVFKHGGSVIGK